MNKKTHLVIFLLLCIFILAMDKGETTPFDTVYKVRNQEEIFTTIPESSITINKSCMRSNYKFRACRGYRILKKVSLRTVSPHELKSGTNPGAVLCKRFRGRILYGVDQKKNQITLCAFNDLSMVSTGTLHYYAKLNDQQTPNNFP